MEGDGLRAEVRSWLIFGLFRERLENRVLGRTLVVSDCWISYLMGFSRLNLQKLRSGFNLNMPQSSLSPW